MTDRVNGSNGSPIDLAHWRQQSVLVVDDEEGMRNFLQRALADRCGTVSACGSVEAAEELLARSHFDLVILDIALPGKSGVEWLHELRERGFSGDVVLITAYADLETAIDALRAGASDFLLKPFSVAQMLNAVKRCFDRSRLARENFVLRREVQELAVGVEGIIGSSTAMQHFCTLLKRAAPTQATVLIQGESGSGKEVAARALHGMSPRATGPFVPINCAAISEELMESELFGHVKGAYTGAANNREGLFYYARGGTLFLDEISELPLAVQAKLLRVLEERRVRPVGSEREIPVDVRVVAATNRSLSSEVAAGRFRRDLYYRLQVVELTIPPLRDRAEDIPALVGHFASLLSAQLGIARILPDAATLRWMKKYDWPGNVRELRNFIERSLILGGYPPLPLSVAETAPACGDAAADTLLESVERRHITAILAATGGNKSEAARRLGISRKTLERKCAVWKL